jgi:hypothetical protein
MHDLDLTAGVPPESIAEGQVVIGRVGDQDVLLVRAAGEFEDALRHSLRRHHTSDTRDPSVTALIRSVAAR